MPQPPAALQGPSAPQRQQARDRTKPVVPDATYELVLKSIRDVGWVKDRFSESGNSKPTLKLVVEGEYEGAKFTLPRDITHSYDARSILSLLGGIILGIDPKDKDVELDYRQLADGRFLGTVQSRAYHPRDDDGNELEETHFFTEWKGEPIGAPGAQPKAVAPPAPREATVQQPKAAPSDWSASWEGQPQGSSISQAAWVAVGPVLRSVVDRFDSFAEVHDYFGGEFDESFGAHAEVIQSFLRQRGPNDVVFNANGKTDAHTRDLKAALDAFLAYWDNEEDTEPDDLPF